MSPSSLVMHVSLSAPAPLLLCNSWHWTQAAWRARGCRCPDRNPGSCAWPGSSRTAAGGKPQMCRRRHRNADSSGRVVSSGETAETRRRAPSHTLTSSGWYLHRQKEISLELEKMYIKSGLRKGHRGLGDQGVCEEWNAGHYDANLTSNFPRSQANRASTNLIHSRCTSHLQA